MRVAVKEGEKLRGQSNPDKLNGKPLNPYEVAAQNNSTVNALHIFVAVSEVSVHDSIRAALWKVTKDEILKAYSSSIQSQLDGKKLKEALKQADPRYSEEEISFAVKKIQDQYIAENTTPERQNNLFAQVSLDLSDISNHRGWAVKSVEGQRANTKAGTEIINSGDNEFDVLVKILNPLLQKAATKKNENLIIHFSQQAHIDFLSVEDRDMRIAGMQRHKKQAIKKLHRLLEKCNQGDGAVTLVLDRKTNETQAAAEKQIFSAIRKNKGGDFTTLKNKFLENANKMIQTSLALEIDYHALASKYQEERLGGLSLEFA